MAFASGIWQALATRNRNLVGRGPKISCVSLHSPDCLSSIAPCACVVLTEIMILLKSLINNQHLPFARCFLDASGNLFKRLFIDTSNGVLVVASSSFYDSSLGWFGAGRTNKNSSHPWFRLTSSQHLGLLVCQTHGASSCEPR